MAQTDVVLSGYFLIKQCSETLGLLVHAGWEINITLTGNAPVTPAYINVPGPLGAAHVVPEAAVGPDIYQQTVWIVQFRDSS